MFRHARALAAALFALLTAVQAPAMAAEATLRGAHGLDLPASFTGTLPCADCAGIRYHLDLWPDQVYHLRREWLGDAPARRRDEIGRWHADPARGAIVLAGGSEGAEFWSVEGADRLRLMDRDGRPIESGLPYEITASAGIAPTELALPVTGVFKAAAGAGSASFRECISGRRYAVEDAGDRVALERAGRAAGAGPGDPFLAVIEGRIATRPGAGGVPRRSVALRRLVAAWPGEACAGNSATAGLANTYWRIVALGGDRVAVTEDRREPHILLEPGGTFRATLGCNLFGGRYESGGAALAFGPVRSTRMACPPPFAAGEAALVGVLSATRGWRISAQALELLDAGGAPLALFRAVYLP